MHLFPHVGIASLPQIGGDIPGFPRPTIKTRVGLFISSWVIFFQLGNYAAPPTGKSTGFFFANDWVFLPEKYAGYFFPQGRNEEAHALPTLIEHSMG